MLLSLATPQVDRPEVSRRGMQTRAVSREAAQRYVCVRACVCVCCVCVCVCMYVCVCVCVCVLCA